MAAAAASLLRRRQPVLRFKNAARLKHSVPDPPVEVQKKIGNFLSHHLQQSKWLNRFPHSISRKCKELEFSAPNVISAISSSKRSSSSSSPGFGFISWYLGMIKTRPVATKSATAALIYTAADLSSQTITTEGYDLVRTVRMAGFGMLIVGPSLHFWFNFVARLLPKLDIWSTFAKMALGQTIYGPTVTAVFFSVNAASQARFLPQTLTGNVMKSPFWHLINSCWLAAASLLNILGESGSEIVGRLKRDLVPTLVSGVMYWPICDFVTFRFVTVHLQPLVSNSFSYLWTIYLTYMAGLEKVNEANV